MLAKMDIVGYVSGWVGWLGTGRETGLAVSAEGVTILTDHTGRSSGEAFVSFADRAGADSALERDRQEIGHRLGETDTPLYNIRLLYFNV